MLSKGKEKGAGVGMKNASALSEARRREIGRREGDNGALSIKPFERGRVTTLWDLQRVSCGGWEGGGCERVQA